MKIYPDEVCYLVASLRSSAAYKNEILQATESDKKIYAAFCERTCTIAKCFLFNILRHTRVIVDYMNGQESFLSLHIIQQMSSCAPKVEMKKLVTSGTMLSPYGTEAPPKRSPSRFLKHFVIPTCFLLLLAATAGSIYGAIILLKMAFSDDSTEVLYGHLFGGSVLVSLFLVLFTIFVTFLTFMIARWCNG